MWGQSMPHTVVIDRAFSLPVLKVGTNALMQVHLHAQHEGSLARDLCVSVDDDNADCVCVIVHVDTTSGAAEAQ